MNIQEQAASETKRATLELGKTATGAAMGITKGATNMISEILLALIRKNSEGKHMDIVSGEQSLETMHGMIKDGDYLSSVSIPKKDAEFFKNAMEKENIAYSILNDMEDKDDNINIVFLHSDSKKMDNVLSLYRTGARLSNEVEPDIFLRHIEDKNIGVMRNLTDTEFELLRRELMDKELTYSFYRKNDRLSILYHLSDKQTINETVNNVCWNVTDKNFDLNNSDETIIKSNSRLTNIIAKMLLDDEQDNPSQVFDSGISYSQYVGYEQLSDTDREEFEAYLERLADAERKEFKEHIKVFSQRRYAIDFTEIPVKDKNLDNIIRKAEARQRDTNNNDRNRQHESSEHNR